MTAAKLFRHETILAILTVIAMIVRASLSDKFFTVDNLLNQGRLMAEVGLISLAMTFVIVTGGIDLSVGSILGLTAILLGVFWKNLGLPLPAAIVLAAVEGGKVTLIAGVTADLTSKLKAGELVNHVALQVGGKGGGRPDMAQAGGTDPSKLPQALASVQAWVSEKVK